MSSIDLSRQNRDVVLPATATYQWLINPVVDWLFVCGASVWIVWAMLAAGAQVGLNTPQGCFLWLLWIAGVNLVCNSHSTISWVRIVKHEGVRKQVGKTLFVWAIVCLSLFACACSSKHALIIMSRVYLMVVVQHYLFQTYGVCLLYCIKGKYTLENLEKRILQSVFWTLTIFVWIRSFTFKDFSPTNFWSLALPTWCILPTWVANVSLVAFQLSILLLSIVVVKKFLKQNLVFPLHALFLIFTSICLFYYGFLGNPGLMVFFVAAYYHGSQNLIIGMSQYVKEHGLTQGVQAQDVWRVLVGRKSMQFFVYCVIAGEAIYLGMPALMAYLRIVDWNTATLAAFSCIGLHHVITEAMVYKLRDPKLRTSLINQPVS